MLRWQDPVLGNVSPAAFVPIAESDGLIHTLGEWVLNQAIDGKRAEMDVWNSLI
ncbi:EAL domain-containing protein [Caballeronia sp. GAWG1-1]|uniref:EAL domain-containing protein n=1 Tax=Caballeronia sp. GAWG1-1 TaxID=2921742 RepID=UPI0032EC1C14